MSILPFSWAIFRTARATDEVPAPRDLGPDVGLGLMVGPQELDRAAEHLAAEIVDRHLRGLDLAEIEIGVNTGEPFGDADLERRRRLGLRQGHEAQGSQAGDGNGPA